MTIHNGDVGILIFSSTWATIDTVRVPKIRNGDVSILIFWRREQQEEIRTLCFNKWVRRTASKMVVGGTNSENTLAMQKLPVSRTGCGANLQFLREPTHSGFGSSTYVCGRTSVSHSLHLLLISPLEATEAAAMKERCGE